MLKVKHIIEIDMTTLLFDAYENMVREYGNHKSWHRNIHETVQSNPSECVVLSKFRMPLGGPWNPRRLQQMKKSHMVLKINKKKGNNENLLNRIFWNYELFKLKLELMYPTKWTVGVQSKVSYGISVIKRIEISIKVEILV